MGMSPLLSGQLLRPQLLSRLLSLWSSGATRLPTRLPSQKRRGEVGGGEEDGWNSQVCRYNPRPTSWAMFGKYVFLSCKSSLITPNFHLHYNVPSRLITSTDLV